MANRIGGLILLAVVAVLLVVLLPLHTRVSEPWLGRSQSARYGPDQLQRSPAAADALRHRLEYRMARR